MKKILLSLVMVFLTISAKAQVTWNVRAGGGVFQTEAEVSGYKDRIHVERGCAALALQVNIPLFKRTSNFAFSPSFIAGVGGETRMEFPLYFGYKVPIGNRSLFFPKLGPMAGYDICAGCAMCGPSMELAFEIKHFIVATNVSINLMEYYKEMYDVGAYLTLGYKF